MHLALGHLAETTGCQPHLLPASCPSPFLALPGAAGPFQAHPLRLLRFSVRWRTCGPLHPEGASGSSRSGDCSLKPSCARPPVRTLPPMRSSLNSITVTLQRSHSTLHPTHSSLTLVLAMRHRPPYAPDTTLTARRFLPQPPSGSAIPRRSDLSRFSSSEPRLSHGLSALHHTY
jgi:hypothetical protein